MPLTIDGQTYVMDFDKFTRQNAQSFRTSVDEGGDSFERSLSDEQAWKRTQYNWDKGAGQDYFDRRESDRSRFKGAVGINPFAEGKLDLVGSWADESLASRDGFSPLLVAGGHLYCRSNLTGTYRLSSKTATPAAVTTSGATTSFTTDGHTVWEAAGVWGLQSYEAAGAASQYSSYNFHLVGYANGRLLGSAAAAKGAIYEIINGGASETLIWTHPNAAFMWKKIVPAPNGIYLVGDAGSRSEVFKLTVADSTGDLVPPFPVVAMEDELIHDLVHYGGLFLASTSRGIRLMSIADGAGHLTYGKVIELDGNPGPIATRGEDMYIGLGGWTYTPPGGSLITGSGVVHVRLTDFTEVLVPPYAYGPAWRAAATSDAVEGVAYFDGAIFWTVNGALASDQGNPVIGYADMGEVNFGVIDEDKRLVAASVRHASLAATASVSLSIVDTAGAVTTVVASATDTATTKRTLITDEVDEAWGLHIEIDPGSSGVGLAVDRWTLEAIPVPAHIEDIVIPVMLKDVVENEVTEVEVSQDVWDEYTALKTLAESRKVVTVVIGEQSLTGFVYDVALAQGEAYDWALDGEFIQGIYSVFFRTVGS